LGQALGIVVEQDHVMALAGKGSGHLHPDIAGPDDQDAHMTP